MAQLKIMFQGGFAGKECQLLGSQGEGAPFEKICDFFPDDVNTTQAFDVPDGDQAQVDRVALVFATSTDFFGRITIYSLDVLGTEA